MNVYIFLALVLVISILFSLNKKNISEGFRSRRPRRCVTGRYSTKRPCTQWVSKWGYCGSTTAHKKGGTDCRIKRRRVPIRRRRAPIRRRFRRRRAPIRRRRKISRAKRIWLSKRKRMYYFKRQMFKAKRALNKNIRIRASPKKIARMRRWFRNRRRTYFISKRKFLIYSKKYHRTSMLNAKKHHIKAKRSLRNLIKRRANSKRIASMRRWIRNRRNTYNVHRRHYIKVSKILNNMNKRRRLSIIIKRRLNAMKRRMTTYKHCPKNCAKPTMVGGNCVAGNPIETKDKNGKVGYFKKCSYHCLGPNDKGYEHVVVGTNERYHPKKHGCRYTSQCGQCGDLRVKGKSKWYSLVQVFGRFVEEDKGGVKKRYFVEDTNQKLSQAKINKLEEMKRKYGSANNVPENDKKTENSIKSNEKNIADTSKGNMFTDITNAKHIGKKDMSLEDYYQRRILNNNTENRLGGSKQALDKLKKMPQDDNGKVTFFNSAWTVFS